MTELNESTRVQALIDRYPFLVDEAIRIDERFAMIRNPLVRALVKKATLGDLSRRAGIPMEQITGTIRELLEKYGVD